MIQARAPDGVVHGLRYEDTTRCGLRLLWSMNFESTREDVTCMACIADQGPSFYPPAWNVDEWAR